MKIDKLVSTIGLRAYATKENLAEAICRLVNEATLFDLLPNVITIRCSEDYESTGELEVILFAG